MFSMISRGIGAMMRLSLLFFYLIVMGMYLTLLPAIIVIFIITLPFVYLILKVKKQESEIKQELKQKFIKDHLTDEANYQNVEGWFEYIYDLHLKPNSWWKLSNLLSIPPLARDWASGFTPTLDSFSTDLKSTDYQLGIREHIIGRQQETALIESALSKSEEANVMLVGERGVGKHTILHQLAKRIYEGKTHPLLAYKRLIKLDMEKILNEDTDMKRREEFLSELLIEASAAKNIIIIIDDFEQYTSSSQNHIDLSSVFSKFAQTNKLQFIGITTPYSYESFIFPNTLIRLFFNKIDVNEVDSDKALKILLDQAIAFENRYQVIIPYTTVKAVIDKSKFFLPEIPFPEKALQLLDSVCVYTSQTLKQKFVSALTIDTVLTSKTHVPTALTDDIKQQLLTLEKTLGDKIFGQPDAISEIASSLRRSFLLLGKRSKPIASFLFLGPTGVGKTETAKVLAQYFFGSVDHLLRFDMSVFQKKEDIEKLLGSVKTLQPGLLTSTIREHPYGVLLLDEIEKAHPDLLNIFLTIIDEGYFSDGYGQKVNCKNLVIIATSNAAGTHIHQMLLKQSLDSMVQNQQDLSNKLINYLVETNTFSPEFLNRFDGVVAYSPIDNNTANLIVHELLENVKSQILEMYKVHVVISDATANKITAQGFETENGARNLKRQIRRIIEDVIAKTILEGKAKDGDTITI